MKTILALPFGPYLYPQALELYVRDMDSEVMYNSCELVRTEDHDCVVRVVNPDSTIRDIRYEELVKLKNLNIDEIATIHGLLETIVQHRREYGLDQINRTLKTIYGQTPFILVEPSFQGIYALSFPDPDQPFDEERARRIENMTNSLGYPALPVLSFRPKGSGYEGSEYIDRDEIQWELGFSCWDAEPIGVAKWNDLDGISRLVHTFISQEDCLGTFALLYPDEATPLAARERHRIKNVAAWQILDEGESRFDISEIYNRLHAIAGQIDVFARPVLDIRPIGLTFNQYADYRAYIRNLNFIRDIGVFVGFSTKDEPKWIKEGEAMWACLKSATEALGSPFIELSSNQSGIWLATIPATLKLYTKMHDHCFAQAEHDYSIGVPQNATR